MLRRTEIRLSLKIIQILNLLTLTSPTILLVGVFLLLQIQ
jgi:hypothetical protein